MAKQHWRSTRRFGRAGGLHKRTKTVVKVTHTCQVIQPLKLKITRKVKRKLKKTMKRVLFKLTRNDRYACINKAGLVIKLRKIERPNLRGYRMMNIDMLQCHLNKVTQHIVSCSKGRELARTGQRVWEISSEVNTYGLASVLGIRCAGCKAQPTMETSAKLKSDSTTKYDINVRAVWGSVSTGNGASHLREIMATMDAPSLSGAAFTNIEQNIGDWWENLCQEELLAAGAEERRLAIEKGSYHQGIPSIAVIADGGWSKRTHKHSYNALGGVGIIIGKETGKILHIGIRNKYCCLCANAERNHQEPKQHVCFKNWDSSSQAMEADAIVDGFQKAESVHGLRYMWLVADRDSSVYARIREDVPVWGCEVQKIECANHACKCLRSNLEKLVETSPQYKGKNKLTKPTRIRLVSAVRCAIRMRAKETDRRKASLQLAKDIRNSVHHVFGSHQNCSDFCKAGEKQRATHPGSEEAATNEGAQVTKDGEPSRVCQEMSLLWTEGSSIEQQELSRYETTLSGSDLTSNMLHDISILLDRLASKSHRLIQNTTTNLAECWMHIRTKFDGGKIYNLCSRGSWHTRCYGGALRLNLGPQWSPAAWELCTGSAPGFIFKKVYHERDRQLQDSVKSKKRPEASALRWKRKMASSKQSTSKVARNSYGSAAIDHEPDMSAEELETKKTEYINNHLALSPEKVSAIEKLTRTQSQSQVWHDERKKRLTASMFGSVLKRRPSTPVTKLVEQLLYSNFSGNEHTRNGIQQERSTIQEYILKKAEDGVNVQVERSGLVINQSLPFLGASPDGVVCENGQQSGLIEVKNVLHNKGTNLTQAAKSQSNFCLKVENGNLKLKENHNYYMQCQGLLHVCNLPWIDFVIRTVSPYQLHVERIFPKLQLWEMWVKKLKAFYFAALLPELASPRKGKQPGIREPGIWFKDNINLCGAATRKRRPLGEGQKCALTDSTPQVRKRRAVSRAKFLGRKITHQTDRAGKTLWCQGCVTAVVSGKDGLPSAVYEILYDGEQEPVQVKNLAEDYGRSAVKFIDL